MRRRVGIYIATLLPACSNPPEEPTETPGDDRNQTVVVVTGPEHIETVAIKGKNAASAALATGLLEEMRELAETTSFMLVFEDPPPKDTAILGKDGGLVSVFHSLRSDSTGCTVWRDGKKLDIAKQARENPQGACGPIAIARSLIRIGHDRAGEVRDGNNLDAGFIADLESQHPNGMSSEAIGRAHADYGLTDCVDGFTRGDINQIPDNGEMSQADWYAALSAALEDAENDCTLLTWWADENMNSVFSHTEHIRGVADGNPPTVQTADGFVQGDRRRRNIPVNTETNDYRLRNGEMDVIPGTRQGMQFVAGHVRQNHFIAYAAFVCCKEE